MVTFPVDDVTPAAELLPTQPLGEFFSDALLVGGDPALPILVPDGVAPLLGAVGRAFADHRPLVLSPDAVWLTIAQGVAQHVRLHAEELRPFLVGHSGRKKLGVTLDGPMPQDAGAWRDLAGSFHKLLAAEINDRELFECDFSTSSDVELVASRILLLDVYSPYFSYRLVCVCGIPSITLTGTVEDWQKIRARVDSIAAFGLEDWCRSLVPIADQFVRAGTGDVDTAFWRRIYNPVDAYGGAVITGWAARLYPYLSGSGVVEAPNPLLGLPIDEPRDVPASSGNYRGVGIASTSVPATLSRVIVNVNDQVRRVNRTVALHAGLVGVAQDESGALRPVAGWHLASATVEIDDVLDRIVAEHDTTEPQTSVLFEAAADVVALYSRVGSATLFDGAWRLRPVAEHRRVPFGDGHQTIVLMIDLAEGRCIGAVNDFVAETTHWVVFRAEEVVTEGARLLGPKLRLVDRPADVKVYGTSLAMLLDAALDSDGEFAQLETGRLDQLQIADA